MNTRFEPPGASGAPVETLRLAPGDALTVRTWQNRLLRIEGVVTGASKGVVSMAAEPLSVPGAGASQEHADAA